MGVGLVRSLQPPDILWIHWRVYNSIANTSKRVTLLPPSDVYVRSFLYLLYIKYKDIKRYKDIIKILKIKLYYTKALSDQSLSLTPDWIFLLWRPRTPVSLCDLATTFHRGELAWRKSVCIKHLKCTYLTPSGWRMRFMQNQT